MLVALSCVPLGLETIWRAFHDRAILSESFCSARDCYIYRLVNMNEDCLYCNSYRNKVVVVVVFETCQVQSVIVTEVSD